MDLYAELFSLVDALTAANIEYAVCGGLALAVHGHARATQDIDLLIREEDLDAVRQAVARLGYTLPSGSLPFGAGTERETRAFRISKKAGRTVLPLDLLLVAPVLEDVWKDRQVFEVDGRRLTVVSRDGLVTMKRLSGRKQDLLDVDHLEGANDE